MCLLAQALLQYHLEFPKEKTQPKKTLSTLVAPQPPGAGTSSENVLIMNSLLDEEKVSLNQSRVPIHCKTHLGLEIIMWEYIMIERS